MTLALVTLISTWTPLHALAPTLEFTCIEFKYLVTTEFFMATYKEIQDYVKRKYGFKPKTCWIADVKAQCNLSTNKAWNRKGGNRINPCPEDKVDCIKDALENFCMY